MNESEFAQYKRKLEEEHAQRLREMDVQAQQQIHEIKQETAHRLVDWVYGLEKQTSNEASAIDDRTLKRIIESDNYYEILGVKKLSLKSEISKSFRKLVLQVHPDKNKNQYAEEAFKRVAEAYSVLSDDQLRRTYDRFGLNGMQGNIVKEKAQTLAESLRKQMFSALMTHLETVI
jgi:preprotein translocase subunit Sec63